MPAESVLRCAGAPRDLGLDQGRWCRASLAAAWRELPAAARLRLRLGMASGPVAGVRRDLRRHFPQHFEVLEGLSRGADVPVGWFVDRLARAPRCGASLAFAVSSDFTGSSSLLACSLPRDAIVRLCQPDGGFASVELIEPWSSAPIAGINAGGLSVVALPDSDVRMPAGVAPAALFTHDCLARFDALDGAIDWCLARPGGGAVTLVLADRSGDVAAVRVRDAERQVTRPADGLIVWTASHAREAEIGKALRQASPLVASDLGRFLGTSLVALDPGTRRLGLLHAADAVATEHWYRADAD